MQFNISQVHLPSWTPAFVGKTTLAASLFPLTPNCNETPSPLTPTCPNPKIEYMFDSDLHPTPQHSLADTVRKETDDGRLIVRFLIDVMQGSLESARPCHRLDAARQLLNLGFTPARAFISAGAPATRMARPPTPAPAPQRAAPSPLHQELAELVWEETGNGRSAVRFLVDVMLGNLHHFKPHHRLLAARELLHRGFDQPAPAPEVEAENEANTEEEDIKRRRAEDPDGIYYRGRDYKWYRDELRSPPHPGRARTGNHEAEDLPASPSSLDDCNPCPAADAPLDYDTYDDDTLPVINCHFQPGDIALPLESLHHSAQPAGQSATPDLVEQEGEDGDQPPIEESNEAFSRERPPPRAGPARIPLDRQAPVDSLTVIRP